MDADTEGAFDAFVVAVSPSLRRLAHARTGDWAAGEDLVQEVFADAFRRWGRIGAYDDPTAWARRAVLNRSVSRWRSKGRESRALRRLGGRRPTDPVIEPTFADEELWVQLRALPDRQLQVVLLLWFEELTVTEVADVLGCGPETVRTHWRRARARLAEALATPEGHPADRDERPLVDRGGDR